MTDRFERTLDDTAAVLATDAGGALVATRIAVRVLDGPDAGRTQLLERGSLVVGSGPTADLVLADPRVSRAHVELALMPKGVRVRDLGSRNGTFVNETRMRDATVPAGTVLRVGQSRIELASDLARLEVAPLRTFGALRAASPALMGVLGTAARVAGSRASVLVEGEAGVGKSALARAIHAAGAAAPLAEVDLRLVADPEALGPAVADAMRVGGTLLLEHVELATARMQHVLAAALDARGETGPRVLATSRDDLRARLAAGSFDRGLFFELASVRLVLPPLAARPEDLPAIVEALVAAGAGGWPTRAALDALRQEGVPGNARAVRRLVELAASAAPASAVAQGEAPSIDEGFREAKDRAVSAFEREYLARLLADCDGNVSEASRRSGVARSHLVNLLKKYELG